MVPHLRRVIRDVRSRLLPFIQDVLREALKKVAVHIVVYFLIRVADWDWHHVIELINTLMG
jgi:hypothetical protein